MYVTFDTSILLEIASVYILLQSSISIMWCCVVIMIIHDDDMWLYLSEPSPRTPPAHNIYIPSGVSCQHASP